MTERLFQITAPHFCAAFITNSRADAGATTVVVIRAAPILKYMTGWRIEQVKEYCDRKKWEMRILSA